MAWFKKSFSKKWCEYLSPNHDFSNLENERLQKLKDLLTPIDDFCLNCGIKKSEFKKK